MKSTLFALLLLVNITAKASGPYRAYLLTQINNTDMRKTTTNQSVNEKMLTIPRYRIPAGSVFCRLEDKLTRATKLWVKIGVQ